MLTLCPNCNSFFDVFGGTGVVTYSVLDIYSKFVVNDFLYSNEVIYKAFFEQTDYDESKLIYIANEYNLIKPDLLTKNYVSDNYGDRYFSMNDAKLIGFLREDIEQKHSASLINDKEYYVLLASLLYSFDKISNINSLTYFLSLTSPYVQPFKAFFNSYFLFFLLFNSSSDKPIS